MSDSPCSVSVLDHPPDYATFLNDYLLENRPVIIGPSLIATWPARNLWVKHTDAGQAEIDWDVLEEEYGWCEVTVADCAVHEGGDQKRNKMLFHDVVARWRAGDGESLYVKDWHLALQLAKDSVRVADFYATPDIFRDDWMNAFYTAHTDDDFRFVYVGAKGTFTPLHRDVYTSYSWSTNVCGRKRWWLFPPEQTRFLLRRGGEAHLEVPYDVREADGKEYPLLESARPIVVEQGGGQTIFVPSGWFHQVENLTHCISINHNWCNSVNLPSLYRSMCEKVTEIEDAISDVKEMLSGGASSTGNSSETHDWYAEWIAIVQDLIEKDAGWNWLTFWRMVRHALCIALDRPCPINPELWPRTPSSLMPSVDFIRGQVKRCLDDFLKREQREHAVVPGLDAVLTEVGKLLSH